jgi:chemotaxis protein CheC
LSDLLSTFSFKQLDALAEVGNIGAGNAATALSKLLGLPIKMDVPKAKIVSIYKLADCYGSPLEVVSAVFVRSFGECSCSILFIQPDACSADTVAMWLQSQSLEYLSVDGQDIFESALAEVGNIILSSFLGSTNLLIETTYQVSVPRVAHDVLSAILDVFASLFGQFGDVALVVNTTLHLEEGKTRSMSGNVIMLPDPDTLDLLLRKLQVF